MAGVSSQSLATALKDLEARLPGAQLTLAEELFGVLDMVDSNAGLRRALTDPAREGRDKAALASTLVAGKVSEQTTSIVRDLVSLRWATARDLGDALEILGATAAIAVAENQGHGAESLERLENDLFDFIRTVDSSHELQRALSERQASEDAKVNLALKLIPHAGAEARLLVRQAVQAPRGIKPTHLVKRFVELVAKRHHRWIANVSVTRPLTDEQHARLQQGLNSLFGRELRTDVTVDPSLIGGVRVQVGDEVVDSTVIARLSELRRKLAV